MPRRRKKSSQHNKPPLIFTESPVNVQRHVLSPYQLALRPPTARAVPVEELDLSWVSPQFSHTESAGRGRRRYTRLRKSPRLNGTSRSTHHVSQRERESQRPTRSNKFKPLKFVGELSVYGEKSTAIDISIEDNISCEETDDDKVEGIPVPIDQLPSSENNESDCSGVNIFRRVRSKTRRKQSKNENTMLEISEQGTNESTVSDGGLKRKTSGVTDNRASGSNFTVNEETENYLPDTSLTGSGPKAGSHSELFKRLFFGGTLNDLTCSLESADNLSLASDSYVSDTSDHVSETELSQASDVEIKRKRCKGKVRHGREKNGGTPRRSKRSRVIVKDTPEPYKGLSRRKRQLKGIDE